MTLHSIRLAAQKVLCILPLICLPLAYMPMACMSMAGLAGDEHREPDSQDHVAETFEQRTHISPDLQKAAGLATETAGQRTLTFTDELFGVIAVPENSIYHVNAPYPGIIQRIHVVTGERVQQGQLLLTIRNSKTLQNYTIKSPTAGEVTARMANLGDRTDMALTKGEEGLLQITDLSQVWVEMSAFPESIEKLTEGQPVLIRDMHQHDRASGQINYISPQMTGGHIARARAQIDNLDGHWRPGMHVKAKIELNRRSVKLAVKQSAIQRLGDRPVVFTRQGDSFEVRMLKLGAAAGDWVEVLDGLKPGTEYVTQNSFLLKADVLKDGASHDH